MPMTDLEGYACTTCHTYLWYNAGDWYCKCQHLNDKAFALTALPLPASWQRSHVPPPASTRLRLDDALAGLAALRDQHTWFLTEEGAIRAGTDDALMCPITALASGEQPVSPSLVWSVATYVGLTGEDAQALVRAADNAEGCDLCLRARLLEAVGLTEQATAQLAMPWAPEEEGIAS